jgi:hypothetical protein
MKRSKTSRSRRRRRAGSRGLLKTARPYSSGRYHVNARGEVVVEPRRGLT